MKFKNKSLNLGKSYLSNYAYFFMLQSSHPVLTISLFRVLVPVRFLLRIVEKQGDDYLERHF